MLIISVADGENIEKALKRYKRKFESTKVMRNLRGNQNFTKPSVIKREQLKKARYVQGLRDAGKI